MKTDFKGIITPFDWDNLTSDVVKQLLKKNIISATGKMNLNNDIVSAFSDDGWCGARLVFDCVTYSLNKKVVFEIYEALKAYTERKEFIEDYFNSLSIELSNFLLKKDKINFINKTYKNQFEIFKNIISQDCDLDDHGDVFFGLCKEKTGTEKWKEYVFDCIQENHIIICHYISNGEYNDTSVEVLKKLFEEYAYFDFVTYWEEWFFIVELQSFCENEISRLKEVSRKREKNNFSKKRLPPLQQLCYVDKLRSRCLRNRFSSLDYKYQLKHLNNITGGRIYDEKLQLETLIELVDMDPSVFNDCLLENHSEYARRLKKIANSSLSNIRKKISLFLLPKPSVNKLDPDIYKKDLDKYNTAQKKISIATTKIEQYFF
ncbi:hypothetical protein [Xanthomarina sp. F2636L]|uniref:hypothetical protein n=1 Tax=Xanthomarina sp. F2636L TaxID=2996018 RepID=UPI00225E3AB6|nr:hypothetical protein [Xanthomarina sp. F2636L]MCX7551550.1 hypothetical protein [Xanthomarina sp. F2636L]